MKPMKDLPLYDIVMKDSDESGMYRISLVTNPAIQENFIYFVLEFLIQRGIKLFEVFLKENDLSMLFHSSKLTNKTL